MIELFNAYTPQGKILSGLIASKSVEYVLHGDGSSYTPKQFEGEPTLVDNGHVIYGAMVISFYLESRYPSPCLLPQDPKRASMILMLYRALLNRGSIGLPEDEAAYRMHVASHGYIDGARPTLADVAVSALATDGDPFWDAFSERLQKTFGSWSETHD